MLKSFLLLGLTYTFCSVLSYVIKNEPQWKSDKIFYTNLNNVVKVSDLVNHMAHGSGVVLRAKSKQLVILTNRHVCDDFGPTVFIENKIMSGTSKVLYIDYSADLCLVKAPLDLNVSEIPLGEIGPFVNEEVYSIGYPLYHEVNMVMGHVIGGTTLTVASPYVNQLDCKGIQSDESGNKFCMTEQDLVATNTFLFPGGSGSPVFNSNNELVGLMSVSARGSNFGHMLYLTDIKRVLGKF